MASGVGGGGGAIEFQAVILAGGHGNRMFPLPERTPKCLLPVGNRPLISYQLAMLERAGLRDCIVITTQHCSQQVNTYLAEKYEGKLNCSMHVVDDYTGTADALRSVADKIVTDFIVVSSDVLSNIELLYMADTHRMHDSVATVLLANSTLTTAVPAKKGKGGKNKKAAAAKLDAKKQSLPECNFIGLEQDTNRVVLYKSKADIEDTFCVGKWLLGTFPRMTLHSRLEDAHVYIFAHWVATVIKEDKTLSSIQNDLIPHLVEAQFKESRLKVDGDQPKPSKMAMLMKTQSMVDMNKGAGTDGEITHRDDKKGFIVRKKFVQAGALQMSSVPPSTSDPINCMALVLEDGVESGDGKGGSFCMRVNTVPAYKRANREVASLKDSEGKAFVTTGYRVSGAPSTGGSSSSSSRPQKLSFTIGKDCVVGEGVQIGKKTNIKKSVVGKYCKIGEKCRITNCVLMDHVTVEGMVTLSDTVVCSNANIQQMSSLDNCEVGCNFTIESKTKAKKEQFSTENFMDVTEK
eukprot:jgi/Bigna1/55398/estExt_Genewise1Plus.C_580041